MGKKNLEQLFRDRFKEFGEVPDERVWRAIEASLDKKKQRKRILPLWWQLGGAAAALALLLYAIAPFGPKADGDPQQIITDTQNEEVRDRIDKDLKGGEADGPSKLPDTGTLAERPSDTQNTGEQSDQSEKELDFIPGGEDLAKTKGESKPDGKNLGNDPQSLGETEALAALENKKSMDSLDRERLQFRDSLGNPSDQKQGALAQRERSEALDKDLTEGDKAKKEEGTVALEEVEDGKKSIYEAIREQEEEEAIAVRDGGRWSVGPSVAPVYFDASGQGSPIHSEFATNSKSGNFNLSYGLNVAYEMGKKVKIRTGVHRVNYGYDTNGVSFSSSMSARGSQNFSSINYRENSQNIVVRSNTLANSPHFMDSPSELASKEVALNEMPFLDGKMVQQLGYIEVPLEVNYVVVDRKFGLDLIGGVSSLFLVDNAVLLESRELVTEIGEANNVNSTNFSANVGMGLNYKFSPKLQLNLEPMFKYQLNTFSNTAGNFHPYSIAVYSGVSFKF